MPMSKHWNWNEEEAAKVSRQQANARRRVKEIFGAVLASTVLGIGPRSVLEIADTGENDKRVGVRASEREAAKVADLLGL
jgi:hypothetical protein